MSCSGAMRRESVGRSWFRRYQSTSGLSNPLEFRISETVKACEPREEEEEEEEGLVGEQMTYRMKSPACVKETFRSTQQGNQMNE